MQLDEKGFQIVEGIYSEQEVQQLLHLLNQANIEQQFGIREFLIKYPTLQKAVFNKALLNLIKKIAPNCTKAIKSIYFDKPPNANWIVNWHQDLTINLVAKSDVPNFINWRVKAERTIVQPNIELLNDIFTIRIHLDDCNQSNGALRVIEGSHKNGVIDIKNWVETKEGIEHICEIDKGGVLLMKPLTLHTSRRTENEMPRRVIHIEFCTKELPMNLAWREAIPLPAI